MSDNKADFVHVSRGHGLHLRGSSAFKGYHVTYRIDSYVICETIQFFQHYIAKLEMYKNTV